MIPNPWKAVKRIAKSPDFKGLKDPKLMSIIKPYITTEEYQTGEIWGLNVTGQGFFITNREIFLVYPVVADNDLEVGIWHVSPEVAKGSRSALYSKVSDVPVHTSDTFAKVFGTVERAYPIDFLKLRTYCQAALRGEYTNYSYQDTKSRKKEWITINAITFDAGDEKKVVVNPNNIIVACDTMLSRLAKLGAGTAGWVSFNNIGFMLFGEDELSVARPELAGKTAFPFILLAPYQSLNPNLGAENIMFGKKLQVYYSFAQNEIINADGSVAVFDSELTSTSLPYLTDGQFDAINKISPKKSSIYIIDRQVAVVGEKMYVHTLDTMLVLEGIPLMNGVYRIQSGALMDTEDKLVDYPRRFNYEASNDEEINPAVLRKSGAYTKKLIGDFANYVSTDELRQSLTGVSYVKRLNDLYAFATNAKRAKVRKVDYVTTNNEVNVCTLNPEQQVHSLSIIPEEDMELPGVMLRIDQLNDTYHLQSLFQYSFYGKIAGNKPPAIFSVVPRDRSLRLTTDFRALETVLSKGLPKKTYKVYLQLSDAHDKLGGGILSVQYVQSEDYEGKERITVAEIPYTISINEDGSDIGDDFVVIARENDPGDLPNYWKFDTLNLLTVVKDIPDNGSFEYGSVGGMILYAAIDRIGATAEKPIRVVKSVKTAPSPPPPPPPAPVLPAVDKETISRKLRAYGMAIKLLDGEDLEIAQKKAKALETVLKLM